ncbi:jumonji protein [Gloeophyllum trabeum ATCC 11539]|uniref:JmjC domain-containing histone demethylation protein 1 n=1 Tax=Gloeophyllum trabeum (strain ATCC 11539 / FP-39264 / Madison 617) TaxID=670483 RepID=S7QH87_GLOTA|nr:jumonji protein [Gloeophyllum trabeum ATCC 11539]EPQ58517.1 jumonji protein [Gloeophyllum trabeum ATCC 11539]
MAKARRRSTRSNAQKSPEHDAESDSGQTSLKVEQTEGQEDRSEDDKCPACKDENGEVTALADKESWIRCDACKTWYHWRCAGDGGELERIDKWFCKECLAKNPARSITFKPPARKSSRKRTQLDYANLNSGLESDPNRWAQMLQGKTIKENNFPRMKGADVNLDWLESDENALRQPIVIEQPDGLGLKMPPRDLGIDDIAEIVGEDTPVEVIDVASQSNVPGWTLKKWAEYYNSSPEKRDKIRNVISLEISGTKLGDEVLPPKLVRELDWVERFWPNTKRGRGHAYPKVQLYCLMGVAQAWTDWHIDFAGSSVYYHVLRGAKVFYFIKPTPANLAAYERWSGTEMQSHTWLGDLVDEVVKVELTAGNTMIIPTGWIHAVYTPVDTLVFGGNFLHSYNVATQLKVRDIEISTHVPKKFRFPFFAKLCWYAGEKYLRDLKAREEFSPRVLESVEALADFLVSEARTMERGTEQAKREAKEQVPGDRVKDASALARELRWRVQQARGHLSDDEDSGGSARKRKHGEMDSADDGTPMFKHFKPRSWDRVLAQPKETLQKVIKGRKPPDEDTWNSDWIDHLSDSAMDTGEGDELELRRRRDVVIKFRRTEKGLERHRVERVVEEWEWVGAAAASKEAPVSTSAPAVETNGG